MLARSHALTVSLALDRPLARLFARREDWASSWAKLLNPGGKLVATVFPVFPDDNNPFLASKDMAGPPWPVVPGDYSILEKHGFELVSMEKVPDGMSHQPRTGMEWIGVWTRTISRR